MKLSRTPFRRTTNNNSPTGAVKEVVVTSRALAKEQGGPTRVESPTDVTVRSPPWSCPASVIAVSEGGEAEVALGTAFSMLELEETSGADWWCVEDDGLPLMVTPEKGGQQQGFFRPDDGDSASFLEPVSPPRGTEGGCDSRPHLAGAANLLDCDLSSYYESPRKTSSALLLDRSTHSSSTAASPAYVLLMDEGETPEKVPSFYCGLMVCHDDHGVPLSAADLQERIARFLGAAPGPDSSDGAGGWQRAWSEGKDITDDTWARSAVGESDGKEELQRRLQRALVHRIHKQQAAHLSRLQGRIQPFLGSSGPCQRDAHLKRRRARSFQAHPTSRNRLASAPQQVLASQRRGGAPAAKGRTEEKILADRVFPLWTCGMNCGTLTDDEASPVLKGRKRYGTTDHQDSGARFPCPAGSDDEEDEGYDSDPETFAATRILFHDNKENIPPGDDGDLGLLRRSYDNSGRVEHDDPSAQVVWEMFNGRFTLVVQQHHTPEALLSLPRGPHPSIAVRAWLERGQLLRCRILPPTLVWKEIHRERPQLTSISLLDIVRIYEAELLLSDDQLVRHSLARASHMFCIQTLDSSLLVEAESRTERDRFVHGLKVVVARLGSFLLCNDERLLDDFFLSTPDSLLTSGREPHDFHEDEDSDDDFEMHDVYAVLPWASK